MLDGVKVILPLQDYKEQPSFTKIISKEEKLKWFKWPYMLSDQVKRSSELSKIKTMLIVSALRVSQPSSPPNFTPRLKLIHEGSLIKKDGDLPALELTLPIF